MALFSGYGKSGGGMTGPPQAGQGTQPYSTGGGGLSTAGQVYAGGAALSSIAQAWQSIQAGRMQEMVAEHNQEMMKLEARYQDVRSDLQQSRLRREGVIRKGALEREASLRKERISRKGRQIRGRQRAAYAGSGVNPDVGSAKIVREETRERVEDDLELIDEQVERETRRINEQVESGTAMSEIGGRARASSFRGRATQAGYRKQTAMSRGYARAGTSLLSGARKLYQKS